MAAARLHPHPSLPAPVVHAGFSIPQSKSHVLAGLQDAYWSDEEEDAECPLCLEEMDISDLNFKPCICGYQICQFCWHHIKENLNKRCPACRRIYTDEGVQFNPIPTEDHKRLTQQKKQRERERKELEALGRRQLANVRVVQRSVVYVVGIGQRYAKEELISTLRSNEYFGQYGKISKIILVKRTPSGGGGPVVGLYITYHRREDAARAIAAVDGSPSPGGGKEIMRASYGTTKYCMSFLRGVQCNDHNCMNLHEWGDEKDCFTKEDLATLKHTMKATETRTRTTTKKSDEEAVLPRAASWAQKGVSAATSTAPSSAGFPAMPGPAISKAARRPGIARQGRSTTATPSNDTKPSITSKIIHERKATSISTSQTISSRPSTPASTQPPPASPAEKPSKSKKEPVSSTPPSASGASSAVGESDAGSSSQEPAPTSPIASVVPESSTPSPVVSAAPVTNPIPAIPPGLSAPPGIPSPSRPPRVATASPQTPLLALQTSYQMSSAARALLDDVKARRESVLPGIISISPFPDLDRTLQTLSGEDGGFSFTFDPKLANETAVNEALSEFEADLTHPFRGSFSDAFPALRPGSSLSSPFMTPPGLPYSSSNRAIYDPLVGRQNPLAVLEKQDSRDNSIAYMGSFNPFADANDEVASESDRQNNFSPLDEERKVSRFGFARGRQGLATTSPHRAPSPLGSNALTSDRLHFHVNQNSTQGVSSNQWGHPGRPDYSFVQAPPHVGSAPGAQPFYSQQQHARFQPFDNDISEAQLRDFIQASQRAIGNPSGHSANVFSGAQSFNDPAIMSAGYASQTSEFNGLAYGPPPGLPFPQQLPGSVNGNIIQSEEAGSSHVSISDSLLSSPVLSSADFPALTATSTETISSPVQLSSAVEVPDEAESKAAKKAIKKAAAVEKAAERQRLVQEKAVAKAVEKSKLAKEKERLAVLKTEQERLSSEKLRRTKEDKMAKVEAERLECENAGTEVIAQEEKQKVSQMKKIAMKQNSGTRVKATSAVKGNVSSQTGQMNVLTSPFTEPINQVPLLSKKPKKSKPANKPIKAPKEGESVHEQGETLPSAVADALRLPVETHTDPPTTRSHSLERNRLTTVHELLSELDSLNPRLDIPHHPFFDLHKLSSGSKMSLEYGPLVHALSALSVGGGSFANNMPTGSIDNAVSSFQQLLETLTQTISDLLRLLPRTTWDDSSSFDGVLRDMLKGDDFLDDGGDEGHGKEDEVAALTQALERRARWMEVQLSKLEELHRDINTAAVRAVLTFNDNGWDRHGFLPRSGNTLRRFDNIGVKNDNGSIRDMTADELEEKYAVANEAAVFAETQVREVMERFQVVKFSVPV